MTNKGTKDDSTIAVGGLVDPAVMREFTTGDIFVEETGWIWKDSKNYTLFKLFEYRENNEHGKGFQYSKGGESYSHFWAYPKEDRKFKNIPNDIMFSFRHGSDSFCVDKDVVDSCETIEDLIRASDFKFVSQDEIDAAKLSESIKSIGDVKQNWEHIKKHGANYLIAEICLKEIGATIPPVINGEIGIHATMLLNGFYRYFDHIEEKLGLK